MTSSPETGVVKKAGKHSKPPRTAKTIYGLHPCGDGAYWAAPVLFAHGRVLAVEQAEKIPADVSNASAKGRKGKPAVLALPRRDVILKELRLPTTSRDEVDKMISNEIHTLLPWPVEEAIVSFDTRPAEDHGFTLANIYIVRKQTIEKHLQILEEQGFSVTRIEISTDALARFLRGAETQSAIAAFNEDSFDYIRVSGNGFSFSRGAGVGENPLENLQQSIALDRRKNSLLFECDRVYVAGALPMPASETEVLRFDGIEARDIRELDLAQFGGVTYNGTPDAVSLGAALGFGETAQINLLPQSALRRAALRALLVNALKTTALAVWTVVIVIAFIFYLFYSEKVRLENADAQIKALKSEVGNLEMQNEQLDLLGKERARVSLPLMVVLELYEQVPNDVAINHMRLDNRGVLILGGEATSYVNALNCIAVLQKSPRLKDVTLLYSTKPKTVQGAPVEFKLQCKVASGK